MTIVNIEKNPILINCGQPAVCKSLVSYQRTLKSSFTLSGVGLHSGNMVDITIRPAPADTGIVFQDERSQVAALASNVVDTSRGTTIGNKISHFKTVEHLVASLYAMGIDNAIVEMHGGESPALDGSALVYVQQIQKTGVVAQDSFREYIELSEPLWIGSEKGYILAVPSDELRFTFVLQYNHPMIGSQVVSYKLDESDFTSQIAPARTFALYEEVQYLLEHNLAKGGSVENAIIIWHDHFSTPLRFEDELVRHKVLDIIGDLALAGKRLKAEVLAVKSGHTMHTQFAKILQSI
jgi:UDP-3-O-[3-hydroxymyristoyl] N-acetylglucosamine deacetylase